MFNRPLVPQLYTGVYAAVYVVLTYFALKAPFFPFELTGTGELTVTVSAITDREAAGTLQPGDRLLAVNGYPVTGCLYLFGSPLAGASPDRPIEIIYDRAGSAPLQTQVTLQAAHLGLYPYLAIMVVVSGAFVVTGALIALGSGGNTTRILVGTLGMLGGLIILSSGALTAYRAPGAAFYHLGLPLWVVLAVLAHSRWPADQTRLLCNRLLLAVSVPVASAVITLELSSTAPFGCLPGSLSPPRAWLWLPLALLTLANVLAPLLAAFRHTTDPFSQAQIHALLWGVGFGLGTPILFSMIPALLGLPALLPPGLALAITVVIPLTYAFVAHQTTLLNIERYLSRAAFTFLFAVAWLGTTAFALWVVMALFGDPSPLAIAVATAVPALLFSTALRSPVLRLVDLALYGRHYDYSEAVTRLTEQLSGLPDIPAIGQTLTHSLPAALGIRQAAFWLPDEGGENLRLSSAGGPDLEAGQIPLQLPAAWLDEAPHSQAGAVLAYHRLPRTGDLAWHLAVCFAVQERLEGALLIGAKAHDRRYSEDDLRVLNTLAGLVANSLSVHRLMREYQAQENQFTALLLEHEAELRRRTAADLHDRGITSLAWVRRLVEKGKAQGIVLSAIERVVDDLRQLSREQLKSPGHDQGLLEALEDLVLEREQGGYTLSLHQAEDERLAWEALGPDERYALYYAIREAVENAFKAWEAAHVTIRLMAEPTGYRIEIDDDGPGFDPASPAVARGDHRGLALMRARIRHMGGTLAIRSDVGAGTTVIIELPVQSPREE